MLKLRLVAFTAVHHQWAVGVFWFYFLGSLHVVHPDLLSVFPTNADTSPSTSDLTLVGGSFVFLVLL